MSETETNLTEQGRETLWALENEDVNAAGQLAASAIIRRLDGDLVRANALIERMRVLADLPPGDAVLTGDTFGPHAVVQLPADAYETYRTAAEEAAKKGDE